MFLEQEEHLIDSMYHCCREESKKNNSETSHPSIEKRFADEKLGREEKFARTETKKIRLAKKRSLDRRRRRKGTFHDISELRSRRRREDWIVSLMRGHSGP